MATAFYSVVQYCPDRRRSEAVNVGLVLFRPEPHALLVRMTGSQARVCKFFALAKQQIVNLKVAMQGLQHRIEQHGDIQTVDNLTVLAASRANDLQLTKPRLISVDDIDVDFKRMFSSLIDSLERPTS
jgi:hypothetical protein